MIFLEYGAMVQSLVINFLVIVFAFSFILLDNIFLDIPVFFHFLTVAGRIEITKIIFNALWHSYLLI